MSIEASLGRVRDRALGMARRRSWLAPLAIRVVVGTTFVLTGWGKLHNLDGLIRYFESLGIPAAGVQAPMVASIELVGGVLLLAGLATRVAALLLTGVMAVAIYTAIWPKAAGVTDVLASIEAIYLVTFFHLAAHGAGAVSLEHLAAKYIPALRPAGDSQGAAAARTSEARGFIRRRYRSGRRSRRRGVRRQQRADVVGPRGRAQSRGLDVDDGAAAADVLDVAIDR